MIKELRVGGGGGMGREEGGRRKEGRGGGKAKKLSGKDFIIVSPRPHQQQIKTH